MPTFPRARYLITEPEYRRWDPAASRPHPNTYNESVFAECVQPVAEAGLIELVTPPYRISPGLTVEAARGHTDGHALLRLESQGERAYFTGDAFHHPAQITRPELRLPGCDDPALATASRLDLVARLHDERAYLFPAHFAAPHYGLIGQDGDEYVFVLAPPPHRQPGVVGEDHRLHPVSGPGLLQHPATDGRWRARAGTAASARSMSFR